MELTAQHVRDLAVECRPMPGSDNVDVQGIRTTYRFSLARLEQQRPVIDELLAQLPHAFRSQAYDPAGGGGWTFLNACVREDEYHWGEHPDVELLLCLGLAIGSVSWSLPRDVWSFLPGEMPYFQLNAPQSSPA